MVDTKHIINQKKTLLEALSQINSLRNVPLVLFVVDDNDRMVGTLTDGDSRRALIAGAKVTDPIIKVIMRDFQFLQEGKNYDVQHLRKQKEMKMRLVPILDANHHILEIINLEKFKTKLPIDAVIMAGGKGERLRPLTEKTPKPLLKVGEKCIIDYNIDNLISFGVDHISVTVNYLGEQLEKHYSLPRDGVKIETIREPKFLGTIGSIRFVKQFYHGTVLLMNSDLFTNVDLEDFYIHFIEHQADMSVAAIPYSVSVPYGIFDLDGRNVKGVIEKPTYNYYANGGIYLIKKEMIERYIPEDTFFNATDFMEKLISENHKVIRYPLHGYWIDIGNKQEYQKAQDIVKHL